MPISPRLRASLLHLAGSLAVAGLALILVYRIWYPAPMDQALAVTHVFLILMGVNIFIGPFLTLIVFKPGKKYLAFDLICIVVLQLLAFGYGLSAVAAGRPAWIVFNQDRFDLVRAFEIDPGAARAAAEIYRQPSWLGPRWVAAAPPDDVEARNRVLFEALSTGVDVPHRPNLYFPLEQAADTIRAHAAPLDDLLAYNDKANVAATLARHPEADAWLPLNSRNAALVVLIEKKSARVIAAVDLRPWR